jgi:ATP-dependent RNA helicase DeaD
VSAQSPSDGETAVSFNDLSLSASVVAALNDVGYESPSPIQAATIPHILSGVDVVGQAQTGTGKTAAFALPILSKIDIEKREPQALVLVPTRELAIQVAEAFQRYATHLPGFHVMPIYGGQSYTPQLQSLRRGVHVVVGTPGRVMDHLKRETLKMQSVRYFVLDEADEMLRMGFIDDVEWILSQAPESRQIALFSATMPAQVRRIAQNHLRKPAEVTIRSKTSTASSIRQRFWMVSGMHKLDALTRILEAETFDAMLVFARTKQATAELAERLEARGFAVEALNGDIPQPQRERTIARLKAGQIDIVVATDVAARGLDVERISHVVNFDVPYDPESYVHRIGRTGRAGRSGEAILFIAPRERNMLRVIERATRQPITQMQLPTVEDVNEQRVNRFNQRITDALAGGEAAAFRSLIERYEQEHNIPAIEIAAALASLAQGKTPLLLETSRREAPDREQRMDRAPIERSERKREREPEHKREREGERAEASRPPVKHERRDREERPAPREFSPGSERDPGKRRERIDDESLQTYRIEVGEIHGIKPSNIVGAIANEAGIEGKFIGRVVIREDHSFVDLPGGMPKEVFRSLQKVRVGGQQLQISLALKTQAERLKREHVPARRPFDKKKGPPKAHKANKARK